MQMPPGMVIFDCDGVLVDSEPLTDRVLRRSLARYGLNISTEEVSGLFLGGTIAGVMQKACDLGADLPDSWVDDIYAEIFEVLERDVEIVPGAAGVLDALDAAGILYAVGSNGPHRKMEITLERTGLAGRLAGRVWSREDVPNPKPAPDVYLAAAQAAGVSPHRCVVVEDSPNGARAGVAAGMYTVGFAAQTDRAALLEVCDAVFDAMPELPALLGL
ncbi:HAD family phosphatase [uncultured Roseobacter sp.]|uniref:HAD family hydrolase n=1 Tax=uncultured Roseobacter sp. TaxID=114847 RepID=UPI00260A848A|nr:HAD family phosphatase [uncultured Roseobacter sp.]